MAEQRQIISGRGDLPEVDIPYDGTFQDPTGPRETFPYIGEQGTFLDERRDLMGRGAPSKTLMHHVPLGMRGPYKLSPGEQQLEERIHSSGYALCNGTVLPQNNRGERNPDNLTDEPRPCRAKAINRSGLCSRHGGALHPLDRRRIDWDKAPREVKWKFGKLPVDELDDEELARGQIRKADGTWTKNPSVSSEIHDKMVKKLFERSDEMLRENLLKAVSTFAEIASGTAYEPADRLKAAEFIFTRLRGKVPTEVVISQDKPFEMVLTDVLTGGSRAESRARRGIEDGNTIDAEFVEEIDDLDDGVDLDDGQEPDEVPEEYDPADHVPLRHDWLPEPPVTVGPAGRPEKSPIPPSDMEAREVWEKKKAKNEAEAAKKEDDWLKNAKAFKKKMNQERARRIALRNEGYADLPVAYRGELVEYEDEPGETYMVFSLPKDDE